MKGKGGDGREGEGGEGRDPQEKFWLQACTPTFLAKVTPLLYIILCQTGLSRDL